MTFDPYKVLKVDPTADIEIISAVYRTLSKKYHPDINKSPDAQATMTQINRAYDILKDPTERAKVDAELARQKTSNTTSASYSNTTTNRPTNRQPSYNSSYATPRRSPANPTAGAADWLKKARDEVQERIARATEPDDRTYYLYQKRLVDEANKKTLRVAVYHDDKLHMKVCNINATAPASNGQVTSGSVYLESMDLFDALDAVGEAIATIEGTGSPIEMGQDHDVYFRKRISGLNNTYLAIEVIKQRRAAEKEALLFMAERKGAGVVSNQTAKQLRQIERILKEALAASR